MTATDDEVCTFIALRPRTESLLNLSFAAAAFKGENYHTSLFQLEMIMPLLLPRVLLGRQPRHHR